VDAVRSGLWVMAGYCTVQAGQRVAGLTACHQHSSRSQWMRRDAAEPESLAAPTAVSLCRVCVAHLVCAWCVAPQVEIISALPAEAVISLYRVGPMVDLCTGPHLPNTSYLKVGCCAA
jgi:hypothetical protein